MNAQDIQLAWHRLADELLIHCPEMDPKRLADMAGRRSAFRAYVAETYDLTSDEAEEAIDAWVRRINLRSAA